MKSNKNQGENRLLWNRRI